LNLAYAVSWICKRNITLADPANSHYFPHLIIIK
jgi:hypothetical protein